MPLLRAAMLVILSGCVPIGPSLQPDEIASTDVSLPHGAEPGMFVRWRNGGSAVVGDVVEQELACVPGPAGTRTIEKRDTHADGSCTVTAARFAADGTVLGVWRGPRGGEGAPLRVVRFDVAGSTQQAMAAGRAHGVRPEAESEADDVTIATAAGTFACRRQVIRCAALFASGETSVWHARERLPLSQLVRAQFDMPGWHEQKELVDYGWTGAEATLRIRGP